MLISKAWTTAKAQGHFVAMWRLPESTAVQLLVRSGSRRPLRRHDIDDQFSGFVVSPFYNPYGECTLFLLPDFQATFDLDGQLLDSAGNWPTEGGGIKRSQLTKPYYETRTNFITRVQDSVEVLKHNRLKKVVLSRIKPMGLKKAINVPHFFKKLCGWYPQTFVSAAYFPNTDSIWMGASPELLSSINKAGHFKTVSLAATQAFTSEPGPVLWGKKEIAEQALVSEFIGERLRSIPLHDLKVVGPSTVRAGNVWHLKTCFDAQIPTPFEAHKHLRLIDCLHPTSALCGMPQDEALDYIMRQEPHQREFYTGYWGPVCFQANTHLFANIRCMQIRGDGETMLYAGCGITKDSNAEEEWVETEHKCQTLMQVLN